MADPMYCLDCGERLEFGDWVKEVKLFGAGGVTVAGYHHNWPCDVEYTGR